MNAKTLNYIPALDGLRGTAVVLVLLYHCCGFSHGWVGVNLFFVLSGFLITRILLVKCGDADYFKAFYRNRVLRIFPLYFMLILSMFSVQYLYPSIKITHSAVYFCLFVQNWLYSQTGFSTTDPLNHTWSLAIEEQFYLFFPLIVYYFNTKLPYFIFITLIAVLAIRTYFAIEGDWCTGYIATYCRIDGLLIGAAIAYSQQQKLKIQDILRYLLPLLLIILSIVVVMWLTPNHGSIKNAVVYTIVDLFFAFIVVLSIRNEQHNLIQRFFSITILRKIGQYSFGIYVYHWPIYIIIYHNLFAKYPNVVLFQLGAVVPTLLLTAIIAFFSYHFVEKPFLKLKT
jgi:peptidoglycan/LPS O-acetylase OafA/YrhL